MRMRHLVLSLLLLSFPGGVFAAGVTQIKGKRALLDLSGGLEQVQVGDELFALDGAGKRKGLLKVTQIKNNRAIAEIAKGRAEVGFGLTVRAAAAANPRPMSREIRDADIQAEGGGASQESYDKLKPKYTGKSWGLIGEMIQTTMTADWSVGTGLSQRNTSSSMKGSSFGVLGFYDYPLNPKFQIRALGGLEQITAAGSTSSGQADCAGLTSTSCNFSVMYLSLHGQAKFNYYDQGSTRAWIGGGYGFLIAMSKSSSVIDTSQISTNQIYNIGTGVEIPSGRSNYIPLSIEYGMFPSSDSVKANMLFLRAGYAWLL